MFKLAVRKAARRGVRKRDLERETLQAFRTIFSTARLHDAELRKGAGISASQFWALSEIARDEGLSVNDLAAQMALHQTTASNLVFALTERRLIRRQRDRADQRVARLAPTAAGRRLLERAPGPGPGLLVDGLRHLDVRKLTNLRRALEALLAVMQRTTTGAAGEPLLGE
jgi:DNA-binding MarR family transcriptional regulator